MPLTVVVGGQYGSEGKGKVVHYLAQNANDVPWLVRCGGPNAGHTVMVDGEPRVFRQLPALGENDGSICCVAAGAVVNEQLLIQEANLLGLEPRQVIVDPNAVLWESDDVLVENGDLGLREIASTFSGTGSAMARRVMRTAQTAKDSPALQKRCSIQPVGELLSELLEPATDADVIIEGTQGFGLSLYHGPYPHVTSRDTTAAAFLSEAGVSPRMVDTIVLVLRTYPIRVGGSSGPLVNEITWEEVAKRGGWPEPKPEYTSVTKRLRRVADFDMSVVVKACKYNEPTYLAIMGADRLCYDDGGKRQFDRLAEASQKWFTEVNRVTGVRVGLIGTGFGNDDMIDLRNR